MSSSATVCATCSPITEGLRPVKLFAHYTGDEREHEEALARVHDCVLRAAVPRLAAGYQQPAHLVGGDRPTEAFELELTDRRRVDGLFHRSEDARPDQGLPGCGARAQPRREIRPGPARRSRSGLRSRCGRASRSRHRCRSQGQVGSAFTPRLGQLGKPLLRVESESTACSSWSRSAKGR